MLYTHDHTHYFIKDLFKVATFTGLLKKNIKRTLYLFELTVLRLNFKHRFYTSFNKIAILKTA